MENTFKEMHKFHIGSIGSRHWWGEKNEWMKATYCHIHNEVCQKVLRDWTLHLERIMGFNQRDILETRGVWFSYIKAQIKPSSGVLLWDGGYYKAWWLQWHLTSGGFTLIHTLTRVVLVLFRTHVWSLCDPIWHCGIWNGRDSPTGTARVRGHWLPLQRLDQWDQPP